MKEKMIVLFVVGVGLVSVVAMWFSGNTVVRGFFFP
jgi:hypothetical protein